MQERQVTIGGTTYRLAEPFLVLATQNPIEQEGTYPLPEAQVDRFMMKLRVGYPTRAEDGTLHFLADSNAAITKGIIALVLATVQDTAPQAILATDIEGALAPFDLQRQLSSNRTQGIPNMIALVRETASRLAA